MSEKRNDGGPAFPQLLSAQRSDLSDWDKVYYFESTNGMSLRDWFAGQALTACQWEYCTDSPPKFTDEQITEECYAMADAMLKAREP